MFNLDSIFDNFKPKTVRSIQDLGNPKIIHQNKSSLELSNKKEEEENC
jgi:hypothetical protein